MSERGIYGIIEGGDGVGKSTVLHTIAKRNREERGHETYTVEEPDSVRDESGNTLVPIAEALRTIIKTKKFGRTTLSNVLLFNTVRRENYEQVIRPSLDNGIDVLGTRNFRSTEAYQGAGEGWDTDEIKRLVLEATSEEYMNPDFTIILDLPEQERQRRVAMRDSLAVLDTFESLGNGFHVRVAEGYRAIAQREGFPIVSALPSPDEVADEVWRQSLGNNV